MDPKGIAKYGAWEDNQPTQGQFRRVVVFNDGSKGWEIYEYGTDGPINQPVPDPALGNDTRQATDWLDLQKKQQDLNKPANPASQSESISAPPNQEWIYRDGPNGIETIRNKNFKGPETEKPKVISTKHDDKTGVTNVLIENPDGTRKWDTITGGPTEAPAQPTTSTQREPVPGFPGVYIVKAGTKDAQGNTVSETYYVNESGQRVPQPQAPEKPTLIALGNGKQGRLVPDSTQESGYRVVAVAGTGPATASTPSISDITIRFATIQEDLQSYAKLLEQKIEATAGSDKPYTAADMRADLEAKRSMAQMELDKMTTALNAQGGIMNREIGEAQSRRSFANSAVQNARGLIGSPDTKVLGPNAGQNYVGALKEMLAMQEQYARGMGGFNTPERTPLQDAIMNIRVNADGSFTFAPSGGASGPTMPSASGIVGQMQQGMTTPPSEMPGAGMGAGMSMSGESLTRPGFSEGMQAPEFQYDWRQPDDTGVGLFDGDDDLVAAAMSVGV